MTCLRSLFGHQDLRCNREGTTAKSTMAGNDPAKSRATRGRMKIREAMEKQDRPELETPGLFGRSVLRMRMRSGVRRAIPGDQTATAIEPPVPNGLQ
jgi:hypothetical protein